MGITAELSAFTANILLPALPPPVVERARFLVLDLVGNIVRARHDAESTAPMLAGVRALGLAAGNSGVFGDCARYTPAGAALLNGALGHSLDFDDTHAAGSLHPGCPVIPAAFAAGEMTGATGADVLAGIIAGYEVGMPPGVGPASGRALCPRLPPHRDLRRVRRGRSGRAGVRGSTRTASPRRSASRSANPLAACNSWRTAPGRSGSRSAGPAWPGLPPPP